MRLPLSVDLVLQVILKNIGKNHSYYLPSRRALEIKLLFRSFGKFSVKTSVLESSRCKIYIHSLPLVAL